MLVLNLGGGKKGKKKKGGKGQTLSLNAFLGDSPTVAKPASTSSWADDDDLGPADCKYCFLSLRIKKHFYRLILFKKLILYGLFDTNLSLLTFYNLLFWST